MATLELSIEGLKPPTAPEAERKKGLSAQIKHVMSKSGGNSGPIEYEVNFKAYSQFTTIREFLQPKTSITFADCVERIVDSFPEGYSSLRSFNSICLEVAEQIPYDHPSQMKLARLMWSIGRSAKRIRKSHLKDTAQAMQTFYQHLSEDITDSCPDPEDEESTPIAYVNFQAFVANLMEVGAYSPGAAHALSAMRAAMKKSSEKNIIAVQEAWILGGAQWILWYGQALFKLLLCPIDTDDAKADPLNLEVWGSWKLCFREAGGNEMLAKECRTVAKKAAEMMDMLETCMSF